MDIQAEQQRIDAAYRRRSKDNPLLFLKGLRIPAAHGPTEFRKCMANFQRDCFEEIAPSLLAVRDGKTPERRWFWWERTKGASKDSDIGACLLWLVAHATRPFLIQVGAADRDQAGIVKRRIEALLFYNEWLNDLVKAHNNRVMGTNGLGLLEIVAADVAGSHGETPNVLVLNELSHVMKWTFIENMLDNARKVPDGLILIATNAGFKGTKAEVHRRNAMETDGWSFHALDRPAPWISEDDLEEAKRSSTRARYMRLWQGVWSSGKGDAIDDEAIERIFKSDLVELTKPEPGWRYLGGLDLGVKHDHAGLVIAGVHQGLRRIRVACLRAFRPWQGEVDLVEVERMCLSLSRMLHVEWFGYDPHQAKLMAQRLKRKGLNMQEVAFTTSILGEMAEGLMQIVNNGILECPDDENLRRDFGKFNIVEKSYGHRLEAIADEHGHADVGTALCILIPRAISLLDITRLLNPDEDICYDLDEEDLAPEEIDAMPDEFKELFRLEDGGDFCF